MWVRPLPVPSILRRHSLRVRNPRDTRLAFEPCEQRHLLSAGTIAGTVFNDTTGNGITLDDTPQSGVTVELYRDDGDGSFSVSDVLTASTPTNVLGEYSFPGLASGTYFVRQLVPGGFTQTGGPPFHMVAVSDSSFCPDVDDVLIDSFDSPGIPAQFIINLTSLDPTLAKQTAPSAIGGERDLLVDVAGTSTPISAAIELGGGNLNFTTAVTPGTVGTLQYDGIDADIPGPPAALINSQGLGVDITRGGINSHIRLDFLRVDGGNATQLDYQVLLTSTGGGTAVATNNVPQSVGPISDFVPFFSFAQAGGFSFQQVTSIEFVFNPMAVARLEFVLDLATITTEVPGGGYDFANFQPPQESKISGFVYADVNDNGQIDAGELGIPGVTVTLMGVDDRGNAVMLTTVTASNGFYLFDNLRPGTYKLVETQPSMFIDGRDTIGTPGGATQNDRFEQIVLPGGFCGVQNNFGERGLLPEFISKWLLINRDNPQRPAIEPPRIDPIPERIVQRGMTVTQQVTAFDPSGRGLIFSLPPNSPTGASIDPQSGLFTFLTGPNTPVVAQITVGVIDVFSQTDTETFNVRVVDDGGDADPQGVTTVIGTPGDDVFEFHAGAVPRVILNGAFVTLPDGANSVLLSGAGGNDLLRFRDSNGDDTFEGRPGYSRFFSSSYGLLAVDMSRVEAAAAIGIDRAQLFDSAGDDRLDGRPDSATLSGVGFSLSASGFDTVRATATTGFDTAALSDTIGDDTLTSRPRDSQWTTAGFSLTATAFDRVRTAASTGFDRAFVYDSTGDDTLNMYPDRAEILGAGFENLAQGFDRVRVFAGAGFDRAFLYDSAANDDLYLYANRTELKGSTFDNIVYDFDRVRAFASGGMDRAFLYDSAGDNDLYLYSNRTELKGATFDNIVYSFDRVRAFATTGMDRAYLYDSSGDDDLHLYPDRTELKGAGFENIVYGFDRVRAFASAGFDRAFLYDSAGDDDVSLYPNRAEVIGTGYNNIVYDFDRVRAYASAGLDRAFIYDSTGDDVLNYGAGVAQLTGTTFDNYAHGFERVRAYATGGNDQALLTDSALDEQLEAENDWACLTNSQVMLRIEGFDWAKAMATSGGVNTRQIRAVQFVLEQEGDWLDG